VLLPGGVFAGFKLITDASLIQAKALGNARVSKS
jgi:hypothetical protein